MKKTLLFLSIFLTVTGLGPLWSQSAETPIPSSGVTLTDPQWKKIVAQFEESVLTLSESLENCQTEKKVLQADIEKMEGKISGLRQTSQKTPNVFDDIRLKGLLSDLKDKLEKKSELQHGCDDQQKELEQKALSLVSLYDDRIDGDLKDANLSSEPFRLNFKLNELALLIQKRNQLQVLLKKYEKKTENGEMLNEEALPVQSFGTLKSGDRESLLLTLDLIRDRKKNLEEQLEKWSIEEDEIRNELKLQGKMQEFLEDIQRINEDSNFPHGSLKRNDLGDMGGSKERKKLEARLEELQKMESQGQATLVQLNQLMEKVQNHLSSLNEREGK